MMQSCAGSWAGEVYACAPAVPVQAPTQGLLLQSGGHWPSPWAVRRFARIGSVML